jgi:hypothetical protein
MFLLKNDVDGKTCMPPTGQQSALPLRQPEATHPTRRLMSALYKASKNVYPTYSPWRWLMQCFLKLWITSNIRRDSSTEADISHSRTLHRVASPALFTPIRLHGATPRKPAILKLVAVRTWNLTNIFPVLLHSPGHITGSRPLTQFMHSHLSYKPL